MCSSVLRLWGGGWVISLLSYIIRFPMCARRLKCDDRKHPSYTHSKLAQGESERGLERIPFNYIVWIAKLHVPLPSFLRGVPFLREFKFAFSLVYLGFVRRRVVSSSAAVALVGVCSAKKPTKLNSSIDWIGGDLNSIQHETKSGHERNHFY